MKRQSLEGGAVADVARDSPVAAGKTEADKVGKAPKARKDKKGKGKALAAVTDSVSSSNGSSAVEKHCSLVPLIKIAGRARTPDRFDFCRYERPSPRPRVCRRLERVQRRSEKAQAEETQRGTESRLGCRHSGGCSRLASESSYGRSPAISCSGIGSKRCTIAIRSGRGHDEPTEEAETEIGAKEGTPRSRGEGEGGAGDRVDAGVGRESGCRGSGGTAAGDGQSRED